MEQNLPFQEINRRELDALIQRVEHAVENELSLSVEDLKLLLLAITTLSQVQQKLEDRDMTLLKLRKLLGMVKQSEQRRSSPKKKNKTSSDQGKGNNRNKNRRGSKKKPPVVFHPLTEVAKGSPCTHCGKGKLYKFEPARLLRITGHAPYEATQHVSERLRCNACQEVVTATLPPKVLADGAPDQQYGYSARALMGLHKFYSGIPYYHQGNLSDMMGLSISASTIFDQCEYLANDLMPIYYELQRQAANADSFLLDDTTNRILEQAPEVRKNRNGKGERLRTGVYSSGVIALTQEGHEVTLFETSLGHAGELIDKILSRRTPGLPKPLVMSDALSSNLPTVIEVKVSYCNSHCRRNFFDLQDQYPESIEWVLDTYAKIWQHESFIKKHQLSLEQRLEYHKEHSLPVMESLKAWAQQQHQADDFEEHSALGKAISYLLRHYDRLTLFCREVGALIDNNRMEETLKLVIRNRKTSHFFKTVNGAGIANVITSVIATAMRTEANLFNYLIALQRYRQRVREKPSGWMPWNYQEEVDQLQQLELEKAA